mmetsp:Transcript_69995/g.198382  ORF Transcript_69995/g.198382 Transcript_69995/m.198382 type:complete len:207 (-) Transcript_69995:1059-1679(-)
MAFFRRASASAALATSRWYSAFSSRRAFVSSVCAWLFCTSDSSICWIVTFKPVTGSSMVCTRVEMSVFKPPICVIFVSRFMPLTWRSAAHQSNCFWSTTPSSRITSFICWIASRTLVKGLPAASIAAIRASLLERWERAASWSSRATRWPAPAAGLCASAGLSRRGVDNWSRKPVDPVDVAATFPNVPKAWSLSRMAIAWLMAASS